MGEEENHPQKAIPESVKVMLANAMDGRLQGSWGIDHMVFFVEFLKTNGLLDGGEDCQLLYHSPNVPKKREEPGALCLPILGTTTLDTLYP
ncbi:hypothetical protein A4U49_03410 [Acidithiobacillus ferrivorans]|uniref:hypothetical protein n=1 Tax=Acidithiobacillus ferrivorans TaxID=160808 RepID=UPI000892A8C2|nr:hypothetical protein [Acidithiobacillus ferrivorans]OFA17189.1 hypothetical protein A4U49_03410 [Acidithiobacillus ferrivorans]